MKVLHLSSSDSGGAGRAACRLHSALRELGIDSAMLVLLKKRDEEAVSAISGSEGQQVWDRTMSRWNAQLSNYLDRPEGLEFFSSACSDVSLLNHPLVAAADLVHLHWVAGFVDFHEIASSLKGKKLVWTLHDMNPFTGGCHYAGNCTKFRESCGACPQLGSPLQQDLSRYIWDTKKTAYQNMDLSPVTPSRWLAERVAESTLMGRYSTSIIPNSVPVNIYRPINRDVARTKRGIPLDTKVLLFGADDPMNRRKGFAHLVAALRSPRLQTPETAIMLVVFGRLNSDLQGICPFPVHFAGMLDDEQELAELYSLADLFVLPSLEDNLPNTVLESMSCGTPVAAFDIGGISDMIRHKETGYLAEPAHVESLAEGIAWCLSVADRGLMRSTCRQEILGRFTPRHQGAAFKQLYEALYATEKAGSGPLQPLVSAVVSTYASDCFMRGCLEDLTGQPLFKKGLLEIVVIDSASPQNEGTIVREFRERFGNSIIYIRTDRRETIYQAWNRGAKAAKGHYLTNANTDDRHRSDALELMAATLDAHPEISLVYGDCLVTTIPNQTFEHTIRCGYHIRPEYSPEIMLSGCHMGPQPMWRKKIHDEIGYFSEELFSAGDYEFWCRIALKHRMMHIPQFLGLYYENPNGYANSDSGLSIRESYQVQRQYDGLLPPPQRDYSNNFQYWKVTASNEYVHIIVVTHNDVHSFARMLESLVRCTEFPHVITVVDIGSSVEIKRHLEAAKSVGMVTNLVFLDGTVTITEAFETASRLERWAAFRLLLGYSMLVSLPGWLSLLITEAERISRTKVITNRLWTRDGVIRNMDGLLPAFCMEDNPAKCFRLERTDSEAGA